MKNSIRVLVIVSGWLLLSNVNSYSQDTSYLSIAPLRIQNMVKPGKAPVVTIQFSASYNNGLMDLAASDNNRFNELDFINGRNFGTRHGFGLSLTGKFALHKEGNIRLNVSANYNLMQSNFLETASQDGKVNYNVFSGALGIEDNFTPDRPFKIYVGFDIVPSLIGGNATLRTDSADFNIKIKNSFRLGLDLNLGFEYAFTNYFGINFGLKLFHANLFFKDSKVSSDPAQTYLNDAYVNPPIPYSGWKQFLIGSIYTGVNYYFGMKNRK
jgi:hypothetical protein